jgi:hypothetical protein
MKRHKHVTRSTALVASPRRTAQPADATQLSLDIAQLSAETLHYRAALARKAVSDGTKACGVELLRLSAKRALAGTEAAATAMRGMAPLQDACLDFWFQQIQQFPEQSARALRTTYDGTRLSSECLVLWSRLASLSVAALMGETRSSRRVAAKATRRLRRAS